MLVLDLVYLLALGVLSPWLLWRAAATGRYRRHLAAKLLGHVPRPYPPGRPVVWFHAVSVGEVNLLGTLVPVFRNRHPEWQVVVSATTDTGLAEAQRRFPDLAVIAWPFDFSWAVAAAIDAVNPSLVVLTESELWPNFLHAARNRCIPVVVVNARLSPRSFRRLRWFAGLARRFLFASLTRLAVQEVEYADRLRQLGVPATKLVVTGSIKFDAALKSPRTPETLALAKLLAAVASGRREPGEASGRREPGEASGRREPGEASGRCEPGEASGRREPGEASGRREPAGTLVWLAGSTHAPEEAIVLAVFARLHQQFPQLRLLLVPRHPDRFGVVAQLVEQSGLPFVRRSRIGEPLAEMPAVVLLDTVGELGAAWGLADIGFTGGSLDGHRGGQSMIEPAGYGVPCVFGPHVWNFRDAAKRLVEVGGAVMVSDAAELERAVAKLITDAELRERMGTAARELVRRQQGATARTLDVIDAVLPRLALTRAA
jgi:3-deoxy-D-manno-octulosonic-acid transferase